MVHDSSWGFGRWGRRRKKSQTTRREKKKIYQSHMKWGCQCLLIRNIIIVDFGQAAAEGLIPDAVSNKHCVSNKHWVSNRHWKSRTSGPCVFWPAGNGPLGSRPACPLGNSEGTLHPHQCAIKIASHIRSVDFSLSRCRHPALSLLPPPRALSLSCLKIQMVFN